MLLTSDSVKLFHFHLCLVFTVSPKDKEKSHRAVNEHSCGRTMSPESGNQPSKDTDNNFHYSGDILHEM